MHTHGIFPRDPSRLSGNKITSFRASVPDIQREEKDICILLIVQLLVFVYISALFLLGCLTSLLYEHRYFQGVATYT